jgi:hypothetical protein
MMNWKLPFWLENLITFLLCLVFCGLCAWAVACNINGGKP